MRHNLLRFRRSGRPAGTVSGKALQSKPYARGKEPGVPWDEWEQLKAEASGKQTRMQLNQGHPSTGVEQGDLKANQKDLAAVGDSAFKLFERLGRSGRDAESSSQTAAKDLTSQGFDLGAGLHHVQERWEKQLRTLLDACAHISNHMDFTNNSHKGTEYFIADTMSSIAQLDKGFDERKQSR